MLAIADAACMGDFPWSLAAVLIALFAMVAAMVWATAKYS
jgi:hypothetical protein